MRVQLRRLGRDEQGVVSVIVAVLAVALLVLGAFTVDFGMAYAQRAALSTGADSAALKVVRRAYLSELTKARKCTDYVAYDSGLPAGDPNKSTTIALNALNANAPFGASLKPTNLTTPVLSCDPSGRVLQASVQVSKTIPVSLGGIAGVHDLAVDRVAQAALGVANSVTGVRPFGVCTWQAQQIVANAEAAKAAKAAKQQYPAEVVSPDKVWKDSSGNNRSCDGSGGSGNWGWLDLGQGNGAKDLGDLIENGSSTPMTVSGSGLKIDGTPGNKGNSKNVSDAWKAIMDSTIPLPVYDSFSGNGSNVKYHIVGFISVQICAYNKRDVKGTCDDASLSMSSDDIEVRFAGYTPVGSISDICGIGLICANDTYVTKLIK